MAKRFKFKMSRIFLCFKFCRSKDPSSLPVDPHHRQDPAKPHRRSSFKRHVSSAFGCGISRKNFSDVGRSETPPSRASTPRFHWRNEGKWHVMARAAHEEEEERRRKIYHGRRNDGVLTRRDEKRQRVQQKTARRARLSTSFADESAENDDGDETESLIPSSRSFSAEDSSSDAPRGTRRNKNRRKPPKRCVSKRSNSNRASSTETETSPVDSSPCAAAVAVVKRSEDPYEDFKGSIVEMIVEKKLFDAAELEQLLCCFLALNSRRHHRTIITAFSEIWSALFSGDRSRRPSTVRLSDYV
ncbi:PREDICTED: transcription repressor OFP7 [Tarenaya hassleriana]|uniref:transcription repressor OFP7 n=1 Tax=Tarenaya hassleriana TaxID=28532 RepID=UPI00053C5B02|nr:PREDICTED: transcription repressor OFP7 [Tarenaya hassleriana]